MAAIAGCLSNSDEGDQETVEPTQTATATETPKQTEKSDDSTETPAKETPKIPEESIIEQFNALGFEAGADYESGQYGVILYSTSEYSTVKTEIDDLRGNFSGYDSHKMTVVKEHEELAAIATVWSAKDTANTAKGYFAEVDGVFDMVAGPLTDGDTDDDNSGIPTATITEHLDTLGFTAGEDYKPKQYGVIVYSDSPVDEIEAEAEGFRGDVERYDSHVKTTVTQRNEWTAVVSFWTTAEAADIAEGFLVGFPGVSVVVTGPLDGSESTQRETDTGVEAFLSDIPNYDDDIVSLDGEPVLTGDATEIGVDGTFVFEPPAVRIEAGTTVEWEWVGGEVPHSVTHVDEAFDSGVLVGDGKTWSYTFENPGVYKYCCTPHQSQNQKGVVFVE